LVTPSTHHRRGNLTNSHIKRVMPPKMPPKKALAVTNVKVRHLSSVKIKELNKFLEAIDNDTNWDTLLSQCSSLLEKHKDLMHSMLAVLGVESAESIEESCEFIIAAMQLGYASAEALMAVSLGAISKAANEIEEHDELLSLLKGAALLGTTIGAKVLSGQSPSSIGATNPQSFCACPGEHTGNFCQNCGKKNGPAILPENGSPLEARISKMEQMLAQIAANTGHNVCDNDQRRSIESGNGGGNVVDPHGSAHGSANVAHGSANAAGASNPAGHGDRAIAFSSPPARQPPPVPAVSAEATSLNTILEAIRSTSNVQATQRALMSPGLDAPDETEARQRPLDSTAIMYRPREWHGRACDEIHRQLLMQNLRSRFKTGVKKINYQLDHLLQVIDFLLQEDLESAYDIINDRMLFLLKCEFKSLEEAAIYYDELRANTDKDTKHRDAEVQAALKARGRQGGRGNGRFTADEHDFFQRRGRGRSRDRRDPPPRAQSAHNPFVEQNHQGGDQSQGGGTGGRRSRRQWRRRGGH